MPRLATRSAAVDLVELMSISEPTAVIVVRGNGGTGKSLLIDEILAARQDAGNPSLLVNGRSDPSAAVLDGGGPKGVGAILVDDAHLLDSAGMDRVLALAEQRPVPVGGLLVAMRPHDQAQLSRIAEVALANRSLITLGPLTGNEAAAMCADLLGSPAPGELIDDLLAQTAGHPLVATPALENWLAAREANAERSSAPDSVVEILALRLNQRAPESRALALAACVANQDQDALRELQQVFPVEMTELEIAGLLPLTTEGTIAPMAAAATLAAASAADLAQGHQVLATTLANLGAEPTVIADHFWRSRSSDPTAEAAYLEAGHALLSSEPAEAIAWFERTAALRPGSPDAYAGRALANLLLGNIGDALSDAFDVLVRKPGHPPSMSVIAGAHAQRGLWEDAARTTQDSLPWVALACLAISGRQFRDVTEADALPPDTGAVFEEATKLLLTTAAKDPSRLGDVAERLRRLSQLARDEVSPPDQPVCPHELGAVVALAAGELRLASVLLESAPPVAIRGAHMDHLKRWIDVRLGSDPAAAPEDDHVDIMSLAVEATVARRSGDVAAGSALARRLAEVTAVRDPDLLNFDAAAELLVLAARFRVSNVTEELQSRVHRFLDKIEQPPMWRARVAWCELEAAASTRNKEGLAENAKLLGELASLVPGLAPLAQAAAVWPSVLSENPDIDHVRAAVAELRDAGFIWEAARLAGQAAIRLDDSDDAKALLGEARTLRATQRNELSRADDGGSAAGLSDREIEVAQHVLNGLTYKAIGEALFISAKTVEHHVSHVRQKLGVSGGSRAEFLAALREDLT